MKKIILTLVALFTFSFMFSQSFKGKITYQASLNSDTFIERLSKDTIMPKFRKELRLKRVSTAINVNFHLLFNGSESIYKAEYDMETNKRLGLLLNKTGTVASQHKIYYANMQTNEKFYQSFWTQGVLVSMDQIDWKLTQESKKIGNYLCYKATAIIDTEQTYGMNFISPVIAWYTPQIPVPFGIQNFIGLPGLTLELIADVEKGKIFYRATKIELNPEKEIKIKKPKGKHVSEQKYVQMIKNMSKN